MINAIAKRRLALRKADGSFLTVKPGEFASLPDEVAKDPMYAWAVRDGILVVSQQVVAAVETDAAKNEPAKPQPDAEMNEGEPTEEPTEEPKPDTGKGKGNGKGEKAAKK